MSERIKQINFNWFSSEEAGEEFSSYVVGCSGVIKIEQRYPAGEGDRHYCTVYFEDGSEEVIFNINQIFKNPEQPKTEGE